MARDLSEIIAEKWIPAEVEPPKLSPLLAQNYVAETESDAG